MAQATRPAQQQSVSFSLLFCCGYRPECPVLGSLHPPNPPKTFIQHFSDKRSRHFSHLFLKNSHDTLFYHRIDRRSHSSHELLLLLVKLPSPRILGKSGAFCFHPHPISLKNHSSKSLRKSWHATCYSPLRPALKDHEKNRSYY